MQFVQGQQQYNRMHCGPYLLQKLYSCCCICLIGSSTPEYRNSKCENIYKSIYNMYVIYKIMLNTRKFNIKKLKTVTKYIKI